MVILVGHINPKTIALYFITRKEMATKVPYVLFFDTEFLGLLLAILMCETGFMFIIA